MRTYSFAYLLAALSLISCSALVKNRGPKLCDGEDPVCDGSVLVQCAQGLEIRAECPNGCDPALSACAICGDGTLSPSEECDDGAANADAPNTCRTDCTNPTCDDGIVDELLGEDCDPPGQSACDDSCHDIVLCGDGFVRGNEACDDGAGNSDTTPNACRTTCTDPICDDGVVDDQFGETCDPPGKFACDDICHEIVNCGDGFVRGNEDCDDGNTSNTDSCKNDCTFNLCGDAAILSGVEQCDDGDTQNNDFCTTDCKLNICGDGFALDGIEECEDGNLISGDGCSSLCKQERCGDAVTQTPLGEQCDDGNTLNTDSCTSSCVDNICGDSFVLLGAEECDDGNNSNSDSCTQGCLRAFCGDGFLLVGQELCEGNNLNNQSCTSLGFASGTLSCSGSCQFDTSSCVAAATCGNGAIDATEQCDDQNLVNTDACLNNCRNATCGDGVIRDTVEVCDDGNTFNDDSCTAQCQPNICGDGFVFVGQEQCDDQNTSDTDSCINCQSAICGDGFIFQGQEQCDDQNANNNDDCLSTCQSNLCGDGFLFEGVEQCDDGNLTDGDGCESDCTPTVPALCGNALVESGESCDDGNLSANDGCDELCSLEAALFVSCGAAVNGDGSLNAPFNSLNNALLSPLTGVIMLLPQSPAPCVSTTINESAIIQGLASPASPNAPLAPVINGGSQSAIISSSNATITLRGLTIKSSFSGATIATSNSARIAISNSQVTNTIGSAIDCNGNINSRLLISQSKIVNSPGGGVQVHNKCQAVIADSLFANNGSPASSFGAILLADQQADAAVVFSTFDSNQAQSKKSVFSGCTATKGSVDSTIVANTNANALETACRVSFTNTFGVTTVGVGNQNQDPLLLAGFHLDLLSPCIDAANPVNAVLPFDPASVFGVNVFAQDFAGTPRPATTRDMGMFEEVP